MSVHEPLSRKRNIGSQGVPDVKRRRHELEHSESLSDTMYTVLVKSAFDNLEKVCSLLHSATDGLD